MLFPITIFPGVPFASDIFLINESAKTESSCPLVFSVRKLYYHHHVVLRPLALAQEPRKVGCPLFIPRSLSYTITTVHVGLQASVWWGPRRQGHWLPERMPAPEVPRWPHMFPVLFLSTTFHSREKDRLKTSYLGSFSPQIPSTSQPMTSLQWFPTLAWPHPYQSGKTLQVAPRQE